MKVIILGALSAIGEATAGLYAAEGADILLVGRRTCDLETVAADLRSRGATIVLTDARDLATGDAATRFERYVERLGGVDHVLLFYGLLGDHKRAEADFSEARRIIDVNFRSAAEWSLAAANWLERQRRGTLLVVSSVAGDRGRQSNYIYGAAKGGLTLLVQGIAHRLAPTGARAVAVKLGYVDTPMTARMARRVPLGVKPADVARLIHRAARKGDPVVYGPWFWRPVMWVVRAVPASLFHRMKL